MPFLKGLSLLCTVAMAACLARMGWAWASPLIKSGAEFGAVLVCLLVLVVWGLIPKGSD